MKKITTQQSNEMHDAQKIADRLAVAIEKACGKPARFAHPYAMVVTRRDGTIKIVAYYSDGHDEVFLPADAVAACEYFEAGGTIRVNVKSYLASRLRLVEA